MKIIRPKTVTTIRNNEYSILYNMDGVEIIFMYTVTGFQRDRCRRTVKESRVKGLQKIIEEEIYTLQTPAKLSPVTQSVLRYLVFIWTASDTGRCSYERGLRPVWHLSKSKWISTFGPTRGRSYERVFVARRSRRSVKPNTFPRPSKCYRKWFKQKWRPLCPYTWESKKPSKAFHYMPKVLTGRFSSDQSCGLGPQVRIV